jgi:hypothetical protein
MSIKYKEYYCELDDVNSMIDKYGVAVIPNILTSTECRKYRRGIWTELNYLTQNMSVPLDRYNQNTYSTLFNLFPLHSMLLQHFSVGHLQNIWNIRQTPTVANVFSKIHNVNVNDLLVSFDGLSVHTPHEITNRGYYKGNQWIHTDQSFTSNSNEKSIQGLINLYDVNKGDASLLVFEKSHLLHKKFSEQFNIESSSDWYKLKNEEEYQFFKDHGCKFRAIKALKGDLVLWSSKCFHQGVEPQMNRSKPNFRMAIYVCMTPRSFATEKMLEKKRNAFNELRTTSHYPHKVKLFPKTPRTYGRELPNVQQISKPILNEFGLKLAGF